MSYHITFSNSGQVAGTPSYPYPRGPPGGRFDYFISLNGNDTNPGTLASPWSITGLINNAATYAGKNVGIIGNTAAAPTVYTQGLNGATVLSIYQACLNANGIDRTGLTVNGGTGPSNLTYVGACNAAGVFTPRCVALSGYDPITGNRQNGGTSSSGFGIIIGQGVNLTGNAGFVWIDGLVLMGAWQHAVCYYPQVQTAPYPYTSNPLNTNMTLTSCEIADCGGYINQNLGGLYHQSTYQAFFANLLIHSCFGITGTGGDCMGIVSFDSWGFQYWYTTIYDSYTSIYDKNGHNGNQTIAACVLEGVNGISVNDCEGGSGSDVFTMHHCVLYNIGSPLSQKGLINPATQLANLYHNTFITTGQNSGTDNTQLWVQFYTTGQITFQDNVILNTLAGSGFNFQIGVYVPALSYIDYNTWSWNKWGTITAPGTSVPSPVTGLANWQTTTGQEAHSTVGTDTYAGGFGLHVGANYKIVSGPSVGASSTGTTRGAWDGTYSQIGCDFTESPLNIFLPTGLPGATHGSAYSSGLISTTGGSYKHQLAITAASPNTGFWLTGGASIPSGGYILSPQVISGTPSVAETETITFTLTDTESLATYTYTTTLVVS